MTVVPERVLVTGAGGYIGTTLVRVLLERGYAVRAIDRFFFGRELLAAQERLEIVREDTRRIGPQHLASVDHVVGSARNNYQIGALARMVADALPRPVEIEWYGDPDHRSYRVDFRKIEALGWRACRAAEEGAREIFETLETGALQWSPRTITLEWYARLVEWHGIVRETELGGAMLDL